MSVIVQADVRPNEAIGILTPSGHRMVVRADHALIPQAGGKTLNTFDIELLVKGHRGMPPKVLKLASVSNGHMTPMLGAPVSLRTVPLTGGLTLVTVVSRASPSGTQGPCHLVTCAPTHYGGPHTPAVTGPQGHCLCNGKVIDPLGWTALYGASLGDPAFIINPGQTNIPGRPDVPSAPQIANTTSVNPCTIVQSTKMLNGPMLTLGECLAENRGNLQPEPAASPYSAAYGLPSSGPVVNPFASDAIY